MLSRTSASLLVLTLACSSQDAGNSHASPVVVNPAGVRDTTLAREPLLVIGEEGDPDYEFFDVRWVGALSDGRVVVANTGTRELRLYSPGGELLASAGRRGEGPGEFSVMGSVHILAGDTIRINDPLQKRLTTFAPDLQRATTQAYDLNSILPRTEGQICEEPLVIGSDLTGSLVSWGWTCRPWQSQGLFTVSSPLVLVAPASDSSRVLAELSRVGVYYDSKLPEGYFLMVPFTRANEATFSDGSVLVPGGTEFVVRRFGLDGSLMLELHDEQPRRPVPDSVDRRYREEYADQLDVPIGLVPAVPIPDSLPGFTRALGGDDQIWAMHYARETDVNVYWSVYTEGGESLGIVAFPGGFALHTVSEGRAYGVLTDPLGVQRVAVYRAPFR